MPPFPYLPVPPKKEHGLQAADHSRLLRNIVRWALKEDPLIEVTSPGSIIDVALWRQESSMTAHLANLTNPMMMKGPLRELLPVSAEVTIRVPEGSSDSGAKLLVNGGAPAYQMENNTIHLTVPASKIMRSSRLTSENNAYFRDRFTMPNSTRFLSRMALLRRMPFTLLVIFVDGMLFATTRIFAGTADGPLWTSTLLRFGALFNPLALDGEGYRVFTHLFLHGSVAHLGTNVALLLYLGYTMEAKVGTKKFAFVFLTSGLVASFTGLYWNLFTIGLGAGGAIAGLLGFSLVYYIFFSGRSTLPMLVLLACFASFATVNILVPEVVHADYAAQFGGVIAGIFFGFFSFAGSRRPAPESAKPEYVILVLLLFLYFLLPRNQVRYFRFFRQVVSAEDTTRHLIKEKLTDDDMRTFIRNYHHWEDIMVRLRMQKNLPPGLASDTFKLGRYIRLRQQENLFKKMVVQNEAYVYLDSVEDLHRRMKEFQQLDYDLWARIRTEVTLDSSGLTGAVKVFYDSNGIEVRETAAGYYRVGFRDSTGKWSGAVQEFYSDGSIRMRGRYRKGRRDGVFIYYSPAGKHMEAGRYVDDKRFGKWETFHVNGRLASEVFYGDGSFVRNLWDSLGNQVVVDGNGREVQRYPGGIVAVEGEYRHGLKEGYWYGRYPGGEMYFEENFSEGILVTGMSRTLDGKTFVYDATSLQPMPEGGFGKFYEYVKREVRRFNSDDLGHVRISFTVTKNGTLADVVFEQEATEALNAKAKEILLEGPRWYPARRHGHEFVDAPAGVVIEFY